MQPMQWVLYSCPNPGITRRAQPPVDLAQIRVFAVVNCCVRALKQNPPQLAIASFPDTSFSP